ncbi:MAG: GNAT family N-acetyltransferase [Chloroflexi bacterium]|nr:GNAT family N-acetyltransferase [Chloroflexota bacterium]
MLDQVMTQGMSVAQLRTGAKSPAPLNRNMVALNDEEEIAGWSLLRRSENEPESRAFTSIITHPDSRRNGIGSALLEDVVTHARSIGVTALKSRVKDSEPGWLAWAKSNGFEIDRHQFRSSITLSEFDGSSFTGRITELEAAGIVFTTLAELGDTDENRHRYYEADYRAAQDVPGEDFFESWPEYEVEVFGNEEYRPEGAYLALDGDQIIGVAHVMLDTEHDRMENLFTGVLREYRGRGIAQAMKLLTIKYARQSGVSEILTENDSENAPMLAVNGKLGYKRWSGVYSLKANLG